MPPPEEGTATTITGLLNIPASSGQIPAVIITHGCGGISTGETAWITRLNEFGVATLLVHSFGARHIPEVCSGAYQINIASVLADTYAALDALHSFDSPQAQPQTIFDALSPGNCAFIEQDGLIIDPETGREPSVNSACVTHGVSIGYNAEAETQAVKDVEEFLAMVFKLE
jgi:dienelactone hydrolase